MEDGLVFETNCSSCDADLIIEVDLSPSWRFLNEDGAEITVLPHLVP